MKKKLLILIASVMLVLAGCGSKPTLAEWVNSEIVTSYEEEFNSQGEGILHAKFSTDGDDVLVFSCIYDEQIPIDESTQSALNEYFSAMSGTLDDAMSEMFTACENEISGKLSCIRIEYVNADGTVVYSYDYTK